MNWFKRFIAKIVRDLLDDNDDLVDKIAERAVKKVEERIARQAARE